MLGVKSGYAGQPLGAVMRDRLGDALWSAGLFSAALLALAWLPLDITILKER